LSQQHLLLALARIDVLLRREVQRWQIAGQDPMDDFRGLYVSDAMAAALLNREFGTTWGSSAGLEEQDAQTYTKTLEGIDRQLEEVASAAQEQAVRLRLDALVDIFGLDKFERDALLVCLAPMLDLRYERIYGYLQDDVTRRRPSLNLILSLLCPQGSERLSRLVQFNEESPLLYFGLLERVNDTGLGKINLLNQTFLLDETVTNWLLGRYLPHYRIRKHVEYCERVDAAETSLADELLGDGDGWPENTIVAFYGPDAAAQFAGSRELAARLARPLLTIDVAGLLAAEEPLLLTLRLALRDARLTGALLMLHGWEACLVDNSPPVAVLEALCAQPDGVIIAGPAVWLPRGRVSSGNDRIRAVRLTWRAFLMPAYAQRRVLWQRALGVDVSPDILEALASYFFLTSGQIQDAAATAQDLASRSLDSRQLSETLFAAARAHSNPRLSSLANKIETRFTWQDIILPADQLALLGEIISTVRLRPQVLEAWGVGEKLVSSRGVTVLFAGPPGTGKTMAAEIIAAELGLDLYKIDLSTMISKYIGETEKNLERTFSEAASSNAILFFDEADALFGKRSEVHDSHDRYANIEISYLLQRMEAYDGVTILATNLRANLDEAFTRRLQFAVDFPFPDEADRLRIWQALFPPGVPTSLDLDLPLLARRYKIAGGNIRNILVGAAYLAAADGGRVTMSHLQHSVRRELQKMGKMVEDNRQI
jgi:ATP-dependent 26S proteasome regulatory subunit